MTIDPQWLPGLNWLRNQCAASVTGPLRIRGYHWMARALVEGIEQGYAPLLRRGIAVDTPLGRNIEEALPRGWRQWPARVLHDWLTAYSHRVAWPLEQVHRYEYRDSAGAPVFLDVRKQPWLSGSGKKKTSALTEPGVTAYDPA